MNTIIQKVVLGTVFLSLFAFAGLSGGYTVNTIGDNYVSISTGLVGPAFPCCLNAFLFSFDAYDLTEWLEIGAGYGISTKNGVAAGGFGTINELFGPFVFASYYDNYISLIGKMHFGFACSYCSSCPQGWDVSLNATLKWICPLIITVKDLRYKHHFGLFDLGLGVMPLCNLSNAWLIVGWQNFNSEEALYLGALANFSNCQASAKILIPSCCHPCCPSVNFDFYLQF